MASPYLLVAVDVVVARFLAQ